MSVNTALSAFPCTLLGVVCLQVSPRIHGTELKASGDVSVAGRHGNTTVSPILKLCVFIDCLLSSGPATRWVLPAHAWPHHYSTCASHGTGETDFTAFWVICSSSSRHPASQFEISLWASPSLETCLVCRPDGKPKPLISRQHPWQSLGTWVMQLDNCVYWGGDVLVDGWNRLWRLSILDSCLGDYPGPFRVLLLIKTVKQFGWTRYQRIRRCYLMVRGFSVLKMMVFGIFSPPPPDIMLVICDKPKSSLNAYQFIPCHIPKDTNHRCNHLDCHQMFSYFTSSSCIIRLIESRNVRLAFNAVRAGLL
jgi:hypothetical protein